MNDGLVMHRGISQNHKLSNYSTCSCLCGSKSVVCFSCGCFFAGIRWGVILYQEHPLGLRPVAFASRKLSNAEQKNPIYQLEFLALKSAVVDKFHDYLYGARFTVRTDNNPLTYVLTTAKLSATGHRWLASLATYDFDVQCQPGKTNIDADLLSLCVGKTGSAYQRQGSKPYVRGSV